MSTNYYWNPELVLQAFDLQDVDRDDPKVHIGKLLAAGKYCKPCGISQSGDTHYAHMGPFKDRTDEYLRTMVRLDEESCPNCKAPWTQANSFTFTMMGHLVTISNFYNIEMAQRQKDPRHKPIHIVIDEMERPYTAIEFLDTVIRTCPIQFQSYGRWS